MLWRNTPPFFPQRVDWTWEEDQEILGLANMLPGSWDDISADLGYTAFQCEARHQELLQKKLVTKMQADKLSRSDPTTWPKLVLPPPKHLDQEEIRSPSGKRLFTYDQDDSERNTKKKPKLILPPPKRLDQEALVKGYGTDLLAFLVYDPLIPRRRRSFKRKRMPIREGYSCMMESLARIGEFLSPLRFASLRLFRSRLLAPPSSRKW